MAISGLIFWLAFLHRRVLLGTAAGLVLVILYWVRSGGSNGKRYIGMEHGARLSARERLGNLWSGHLRLRFRPGERASESSEFK
jgi:hypothetical protein